MREDPHPKRAGGGGVLSAALWLEEEGAEANVPEIKQKWGERQEKGKEQRKRWVKPWNIMKRGKREKKNWNAGINWSVHIVYSVCVRRETKRIHRAGGEWLRFVDRKSRVNLTWVYLIMVKTNPLF